MRPRSYSLVLSLAASLCASAQCSIDVPQDTVILYRGYGPMACATLTAEVDAPAPYVIAWSNGATGLPINVCDTIGAWYFVTVTSDTLCSATDSVFVEVVDVTCGNNEDKVLVCHVPPGNPANAHTICISANGVPAHLAHGCHLGECAVPVDTSGTDDLHVDVTPNPVDEAASVHVRSNRDQHVRLRLVDATGRTLHTILDADLSAHEQRILPLAMEQLPQGTTVAWIEAQGASGRQVHPLVLAR